MAPEQYYGKTVQETKENNYCEQFSDYPEDRIPEEARGHFDLEYFHGDQPIRSL